MKHLRGGWLGRKVIVWGALLALTLWVIPTVLFSWRVREELPARVPVSFRAVWATLCGGRFGLRDVCVRNPPGYGTEPALAIRQVGGQIRLAALGRRGLWVRRLVARDVRVNLRRNRAGEINLAVLVAPRNAEKRPTSAAPVGAPSEPSAPSSGRRFMRAPSGRGGTVIDRLEMDGVLIWRDETYRGDDPGIVLDWTLRGEDVRTGQEKTESRTRLRLQARGRQEASPLRIEGSASVRPDRDVGSLDFEAEGTVDEIGFPELERILGPLPVEADGGRLHLRLVCREGRFQKDQSWLRLGLRNLRRRDESKGRAVPQFWVAVPLSGTLRDPQLDWKAGLAAAMLEHAAHSPEDLPALLRIVQPMLDR